MSVIKCAQCGHENDLTRVFCQNCGTRLERPEGTPATMSGHTPVMGKAVPGTLKKPARERGLLWAFGTLLRGVISTAIMAAILAALIQMSRSPDEVPPYQATNEAAAAQFFQSVQSFANTSIPRTMDITQDQANTFLAARLVPAEGKSDALYRPKFVRAFVVVEEGRSRFYLEQKLLTRPMFIYLTFAPKGGSRLDVVGGGIGRMPCPKFLLPVLERNLGRVGDSLAEARALLRSASEISFRPGVAKVTWQNTATSGQ